MMILSSLFFAVVSVVRRRFSGLKEVGMLSRRKSVSAPIQILLCAFDCFALFVINQENHFEFSPIDYWLPLAPQVW